jgi:hypothetical protein
MALVFENLSPKLAMRIGVLVVSGAMLVVVGCGEPTCHKSSCQEYYSISDAQGDFEANSKACTSLDNDGDGLACNEPNNQVTLCPSTAACGCSGKRKADCNSSCCSWVVGQGCGCNPDVP